ncbi:MAG: hypothetical protein AABX55_02380 [Nanoarchaeota archaeon]
MDKKGAELTLNTIIVLILAVLVLVVIIIAFRTQISSLFNSLTNLIGITETNITILK